VSLSTAELDQVQRELQALVGALVQKVFVPGERLLLLELRVPGASHLLRLDARPGATRMHLAASRPPSPAEALPFQSQARTHLLGKRLVALERAAGDRVVVLRFGEGDGERRVLAELTGRHGNLFLLGAREIILGMAGPNASTQRALGVGKPYLPPTSTRVERDDRTRFTPGPDHSISKQIDALYAAREAAQDHQALRAQLGRPLRQRLLRNARTLVKVEAEAARTANAEVHQRAGELLKTSLHQIPRGATQVTLTDYGTGEARPVTIALRPELSAADNLAWHFRQYKRLTHGARRAGERLGELQAERASLTAQLQALEAMDDVALRARAAEQPVPRAPSRKKHERSVHVPFRTFHAQDGSRIWVGKGAADNDQLTFKHARPHDLWLHARGRTGAHVVVPLERRAQVQPEVLLDACALALHFSDARDEPRAEVSHVPVKALRKPKGGKPGQVIYSQEKTLLFAVEPARLARLLASEAR